MCTNSLSVTFCLKIFLQSVQSVLYLIWFESFFYICLILNM